MKLKDPPPPEHPIVKIGRNLYVSAVLLKQKEHREQPPTTEPLPN